VNRSLVNAAWLGNSMSHLRRYGRLTTGGAVPEDSLEYWSSGNPNL